MASKSRWETPCSNCSAQLAGKRSSADAHEYLMRTASRPGAYECLICGVTPGCKNTGEWHLVQAVTDVTAACAQRKPAASDGQRAG